MSGIRPLRGGTEADRPGEGCPRAIHSSPLAAGCSTDRWDYRWASQGSLRRPPGPGLRRCSLGRASTASIPPVAEDGHGSAAADVHQFAGVSMWRRVRPLLSPSHPIERELLTSRFAPLLPAPPRQPGPGPDRPAT